MITEEQLREIGLRCAKAQNGPWQPYIEGRDHDSGNSFIMTGNDDNRGEDIEMTGATVADFDFIAHSKQDIPLLIKKSED